MIRRAALDPRVERIFAAPGIKKKLCETAGGDRSWLRKVRPYYGHNEHIHVRLSCPAGTPCRDQAAPPPGDGCGADLDYWFSAEPYKKAPPPAKPPKQVMMSDLPPACRNVLQAAAVPGAVTMREAFAMNAGLGTVAAPDAGVPVIERQPARTPKPRPGSLEVGTD